MDRISELSDELLLKILLLVPTEVAVSTSILSKRWEYIWMWLPKLEFRVYSESECRRLRCFLDRNMPLYRAPVLETFRLELFCSCLKPENINMWVLNAISHCLRELVILHDNTDPAKSNILPSSLYICKSLVVLKLGGDILLDVPRMVSLPSLETLELQSVRFFSEETLQQLLSSCPILEDLLVDLRENDTRGKLTVAVPSLQSLSLYIPCDHDIDGYVIETPALKYFKIWDHNTKSHYYLIEHMPYLIEAHLDVRLPDIKSIIGSITSVKRLTICSPAMLEGFVFCQLEHLEVCICKEYSSNQLVRLLESSSTLQGLHLSLMDEHDGPEMVYSNQPTTVPECLLSSLQTLSWSFYKKTTRERYCGLHSETCSSLKDCNNRVISIVGCSKI